MRSDASQPAKALQPTEMSRAGDETAGRPARHRRGHLLGLQVRLAAKSATGGQRPQDPEEQPVDVLVRHRAEDLTSRQPGPPLPVQPGDLVLEVGDRLRHRLARTRRARREELQARALAVEHGPAPARRTGRLPRRDDVDPAGRPIVIRDESARPGAQLGQRAGLCVGRQHAHAARLPHRHERHREGVGVLGVEQPATGLAPIEDGGQPGHIGGEGRPVHGAPRIDGDGRPGGRPWVSRKRSGMKPTVTVLAWAGTPCAGIRR